MSQGYQLGTPAIGFLQYKNAHFRHFLRFFDIFLTFFWTGFLQVWTSPDSEVVYSITFAYDKLKVLS